MGIVVVVVLVVLFIFFGKYIGRIFTALIYDYLFDCGLSFVDEPFGGVAMLDWGDWIGAIFIYKKYSKIVGVAIAILIALF